MTEVMLDTNTVSALVGDPGGAVAERIRALRAPVSVSIVVAAELLYGAAKKGSARLSAAVGRVLGALEKGHPSIEIFHLRLLPVGDELSGEGALACLRRAIDAALPFVWIVKGTRPDGV